MYRVPERRTDLRQDSGVADGEHYLRVADAAELLGVHAATIARRVKDGRLPGAWVGKILYVQTDALHAMLRESRVRPGDLAHLYEPSVDPIEGAPGTSD